MLPRLSGYLLYRIIKIGIDRKYFNLKCSSVLFIYVFIYLIRPHTSFTPGEDSRFDDKRADPLKFAIFWIFQVKPYFGYCDFKTYPFS